MSVDKQFIKNIETVREQPIYDILKHHINDLERRGANHIACCPIHGEKTPSFTVSPSKNIWKCFGCGRGGDAIHFLTEHVGMSFYEAAREIATICGFELELDSNINVKEREAHLAKAKEEKDRLLVLMKKVHDFYLTKNNFFPVLSSSYDAEYSNTQIDVLGRSYKLETLDKFGVCFAPGNCALYQHAKRQKWNLQDLQVIGAIKKSDNGYYDFFNNRVLFPIYDHLGNVVGFGGRAVVWDKKCKFPKYMNSPDTPIYSKSEIVYGLYQTMRAIRNAGWAHVVEGYTDALTMWDNEVHNVVATCGTALSIPQVKLIKRHTYTEGDAGTILSLRDADKAGIKAAINDVEKVIESDMKVEVSFLATNTKEDFIAVHGKEAFAALLEAKGNDQDKAADKDKKLKQSYSFLPITHDPDSFLRQYGRDLFIKQVQTCLQDGIMWRVLDGFEKDDFDKKLHAVNTAGRLLSFIKTDMKRDHYLKRLIKVMGKDEEKHLKEAIQDNTKKRLKPNVRKHKNNQLEDLRNYQFYIDKNRYMIQKTDYDAPISNCIIEPQYHVASMEAPTRVVKITNYKGEYYIVNWSTDLFVNLNTLKPKLEGLGNFKIYADARQWQQITNKLYEEMPSVFKISTLGWHKKGFYVWCNGISYDGNFYACNESGIVQFHKDHFLLPGFDFFKDEDRFDDAGNTDQYIKLFKYIDGGDIDFESFTAEVLGVFGENGMMGLAYYLASLYRDIIYPKTNTFPHLFLFGPKSKGKSTLAWFLMAMFGMARRPAILGSLTIPAFSALFEQLRNGIVWGDEYHNGLPMDWLKLIMNVFDGGGRDRRNVNGGSKSIDSSQILSSFVLSGQDLPTKEVALYTRCITLHFNYMRTPEGDKRFSALNKKQKSGMFSRITNHLQKYRKLISTEYDQTFDQLKSEIDVRISKRTNVDSRMLQNHLMPLTVVKILHDVLPFTKVKNQKGETISFLDALKTFVIEIMVRQNENISQQDEIGTWWSLFEYQLDVKLAKHNFDFVVDSAHKVRVKKKGGGRKETTEIMFTEEKKLLYLKFNKVFLQYDKLAKERDMISFNKNSLETYFEQSEEFIGVVRAKRINGKLSEVYVFDAKKLYDNRDIDLMLTKNVTTKEEAPTDVKTEKEVNKVFGPAAKSEEWDD